MKICPLSALSVHSKAPATAPEWGSRSSSRILKRAQQSHPRECKVAPAWGAAAAIALALAVAVMQMVWKGYARPTCYAGLMGWNRKGGYDDRAVNG